MRLCWICDLVKRHHAAKAMFCFKMFWCNAPIRSQRSGTRAQLEPRPCTAGRAAALRGTHTPAFPDYTVTSREKNRNAMINSTHLQDSHITFVSALSIESENELRSSSQMSSHIQCNPSTSLFECFALNQQVCVRFKFRGRVTTNIISLVLKPLRLGDIL